MKGGVCDAKAVPRNDGDVYAKGQWWMQATAMDKFHVVGFLAEN